MPEQRNEAESFRVSVLSGCGGGKWECSVVTDDMTKIFQGNFGCDDGQSLFSLAEKERISPAGMDSVVRHLISRGMSISTMESCTGGLLASGITDTEGASAIFKGGFVTYSNEAKTMHGVSPDIIERCGVYSLQTAEAMAEACRDVYGADLGVGVTGSTGNPDPENEGGRIGEIYYVILWGDKICRCRLNLETEGISRREIKGRVIDEVARSLGTLLMRQVRFR